MKKLLLSMLLVVGMNVMAQQTIQLRSVNKAECGKSDMTSLKASFSFSTIEAQDYENERGTFSWLSLPNTVIGGNEGDPQIPVLNELIAVPFGAQPRIEITSYSTTDYRLDDYGIHTLVPRQPSLRKDQRPEDVPFVYNANAYQTRGLRSTPQAFVSVDGTMRGIQVGKMTIEPVSYDPVNNTLRVFNDIEVTVSFDGADVRTTDEMLVKTYSPYFDVVYNQLFNGRMVRDAYSEHPDLYTTPVKMIVITTATYANNATFQNWVNWKKQKGIYTTVYTTATTGTTSASIKSFIRNKYNEDAPTFVVIVGDTDAVTYSLNSSITGKVTDLYYSSTTDADLYPEMFLSRMPISSSTELTNLLNKILTYEQYTMADPSYLGNTLLIAGWDASWNPRVGKPTIQYANTYYFNETNNINPYVFLTTGSGQTTCYNYINNVGFANYTAHGGQTGWSDPGFGVSNVSSMTNNDKYLWAMGNCCLAADWGYSGTCFAEALLRAANKGAFGYIGSCPETYWWEDYFFGVGATTVSNQMPTMEQTKTGAYDAMFDDTGFNTLNSVPFIGNIAVAYSHAGGYNSSVTDMYYWEAYHCLGDGSVMPYHTVPATNNVSHASTIGIGMTTFTVSADAGSYVAISRNNEILGVAQVGATGTVEVPITPVTTTGDVMVVVTRNQRQPYVQTVEAIPLDGPFISVDGYTPETAHVGDNTDLSITFKNVGLVATTSATTVTLTPGTSNVTVVEGTQTFGALAANASTTVDGFRFRINSNVADATNVILHYAAVNGSNTWEGDIAITAGEAVLEYENMIWDGGFTPGQTLTVTAKFKNTGHYQATNAVATMSSTSSYVTISNPTINVGTIAADEEVSCQFDVTIAANCPETAQMPVTFTMTADGNLSAQGTGTLKNACNVVFNLSDSYGDGWNGNILTVSFNDGTPSQNLTISSGSSATYVLEIGSNVHVTLTWTTGNYASECSFTVKYEEGDVIIYQSSGTPSAGVLHEFDCNCAAATSVYNVNVTSSNINQGTVSGGGEFNYGQSCTVTATPAEGYMFATWTVNGEVVSTEADYTFIVNGDIDLVANFAEGILIGDGGAATNSYLPSYNWYKYTLSQQIYTAAELGEAGTINSIAFYNGGAEKTRTYDFYLKATTKSSFSSQTDWVAVSASDKVFTGSVTMVDGGWTVINFNTPFEYDGISNLILVADDNTGEFTNSPHMACRVFDASNQAIYVYSDNTNYDPTNPSSVSGTVLSVKNQLILSKEGAPVEFFDVTVSANPSEGGTVSGGGAYGDGESCTVTATPAEGYYFLNWTVNGEVVSTEAEYTFTVTGDVDMVANFNLNSYQVTATANPAEGGTITFSNTSDTTPLFYDFEDGTTQGWTILQGTNGDSPNSWMHCANYAAEDFSAGLGHNASNGFMLSESYVNDGNWGSAHPDNYLVSPQIRLGGSINFWATNLDNDYGAEHFAVAVSTNGNTDVNDFATVQEWTLSVARTGNTRTIGDGTWYEYTADLSAFSGLGYVAIHHFDCYDQWLLCIDDITIVEDYSVTNEIFNYGESCTVTATPAEGYYFLNWTVNGEVVSTEAEYTFTVTGDVDMVANFNTNSYQVTATANPAEGGTITFSNTSDTTPLFYDFEDGTTQGWTILQGTNGDSPNSWMHCANYAAEDYSAGYGHNASDGFMLSESFVNDGDQSVHPDNYLVSPQIRLGGSINFWATNLDNEYGAEHFAVAVSTNGNTDVNDFATVQEWTLSVARTGNTRTIGDGTWYEYTADLSAFSGLGYVAIHHFDCYDQWLLCVDDITIVEDYSVISETFNYGESCTVTANANEGFAFVNWTEGDEVVSTEASFGFVVTSGRNLVAHFIPVQTVNLSQGWNWSSINVEITLEQLQNALVTALPGTAIIIKSKAAGSSIYNGTSWRGRLTSIDVTQMYRIQSSTDSQITLEGMTINPAEHPVTILSGTNWIGFPLNESMSISEAFDGFPVRGDMIKSKDGIATFNGTSWRGNISTLEPGKGYIYQSNAPTPRSFTFPTNPSK